jgi:outer membrane protein TolC
MKMTGPPRPTRSCILIFPILTLLMPCITAVTAHADQPKDRPPVRHDLEQLIALAKKNYPGVEAARQAIAAMEGMLFQAKWAWIPQATVKGFVAPSTEISCLKSKMQLVDEKGDPILDNNGNPQTTVSCVGTDRNPTSDPSEISWAGLYGRLDMEFGMPIYTFDKLGSAKRAARAGVAIKEAELLTTIDRIVRDVSLAYWGLKLAREILYTINDGKKYLDKALKKIEEDLEQDRGDATETDLLRLKTATAEVESRIHEAKKGEALAMATLRTLTGQQGKTFGVDDEVLAVMKGDPQAQRIYLELARQHRPEVKLLEAVTQASQAAVDLEKAKFYPDFALVAMLGFAGAMGVDDPKNAFLSDPFNYVNAGFGLAMKWKWDQVLQYGRYRSAKAQALQAEAGRKEALAGMELEVKKVVLELDEARKRMESTHRGQKSARSWLVATSQNLELGTAEPKDLTDALIAYFTLRLKYLKAVFDVNARWSELKRVVGTSPPKK